MSPTLSLSEKAAIEQGLASEDEILNYHKEMSTYYEEICREENMQEIRDMEEHKTCSYQYDLDDLPF